MAKYTKYEKNSIWHFWPLKLYPELYLIFMFPNAGNKFELEMAEKGLDV